MDKENKKALIALIVMGIIGLIGIGFVVYIYVTYGNKTVSEIPAWVLPFFIGRD